MEENIFILSYCVEECYRSREMLVVVAIDFKKAFDSIDRRGLIEAMKHYRCDSKLIDIVVGLYEGDCTRIEREGTDMGSVEVKNGIRQGCTGSPTMFIMVISRIIGKMLQTGLGFRKSGIYIPVLFYADDGLILARSMTEAEKMLNVLQEEARLLGLEINTEKSGYMVFNGVIGQHTRVGNIKQCQEMTYLGVKIIPKRDLFAQHRAEKINVADKMANVTYSVIGRACDRLLLGKTYWKNVVLPSVLISSEVIVWREREKERLQRIENGVWRRIFGAPSYTPVAALQGEVGCSSVASRDLKTKLAFVRFMTGAKNGILRKIIDRMRRLEWRGSCNWFGCVEKYMGQLGVRWLDLETISNHRLMKMADDLERERWRMEVENRSSLHFYRIKTRLGGESYTSGWGSRILFLVRTNTIRLNWRARHWGGEVNCPLCGDEETLEHFVLSCPNLENVRREFGVSNMKEILCFGEVNTEKSESYLEKLWKVRREVVGGER